MTQHIIDTLHFRYAVKQFIKDKKVDDTTLSTILEAGRMAPTAYGLQPFTLIHVKDTDLRQKIREAAFNQPQVTDAGDVFVIARRTDINDAFVDEYVARTAQVREVSIEDLKGFSEMMKGDILSRDENAKASWAGRQAYIALGMMVETAALLKVDAASMEGFIPSQIDEILNLKEHNLASLGLFAVGYRDESDAHATLTKVRRSKEDLILVR